VTGWDWDADLQDPLTARRIPVTSMDPVCGYFVAFDRSSPKRPTEAEIRAIQSFILEIRQEWELVMRSVGIAHHPFDWFPGYNTVVLHKYAANDWAHTRSHRVGGVPYPPAPAKRLRTQKPNSLVQVMDRVRMDPRTGQVNEEWALWKKQRPEVFDVFDVKETKDEEDTDA
jgi:hypothetical protein